MDYAIVRFGNKQHRVRDGETLVVDRVPAEEGASFEPEVLLGEAKVTATVVAHERGPKVRIGKYRRRTGYRRHNGHRSATSRVLIALGSGRRAAPPTAAAAAAGAGAPPAGYADLTIAGIKAAAEEWSGAELEAALAYERANAARKGAISALEAALAKGGEG
ncbi:MAG TPA: 50S ribosomal protein L21 [Gaiellaceae bacterium]|nr:50S ribosomal protein L21 [Gaiellaceae bacterium]